MMKRDTTRRRAFLKTSGAAAAVGLTGVTGCLSSLPGGGTPSLGLAFTVPVENIGSLFDIPEIRNELSNVGSEYELSVTRNQSTPDSLNQMASGEVDMALLTTVSYASAVQQQAVPGNISMIATDFWDAHPDYYGISVFSGPDSDVTEPKDLKGKTIAVNSLGTGVHGVIVKKLKQVGIDPENGADVVELPFPTMTSAIKDGRVDAVILPALFAVSARKENFTKVYSSQDAWKQRYPFAYVVASQNSLDNKSEAFKAWGEDFTQLIDYCYNNRSRVVSLAAKHFELPEAVVDGFFLTKKDYFRQDVNIDYKRLQYTMDELVNLGFIESSFDVKKYATNEYLPNSSS